MKKIIIFLFLIILGVSVTLAQNSILNLNTNSPYKAGDFDFSIAPTISSPSLFAQGIKNTTYGYDFITEYYTSQTIGTALLIGNRNYQSPYAIDHIAALANYRFLPAPNNKFLNKFAIIIGTGAEQDILQGSTGFLLSGGIDMDCSINNYHFRPNITVYQSINIKSSINDTTIRVSIKLFSF